VRRGCGSRPVPLAQLALATILQAYTGASDDEVIEACVMDGAGGWCWAAWTTRWRCFEGNPGRLPRPAGRARPRPAAGGTHRCFVRAGRRPAPGKLQVVGRQSVVGSRPGDRWVSPASPVRTG